jgi:hypothetical protein
MLHVVKINNLYKEITIPVNESITTDMLLNKYGIVADVEIVGQSGGGSDLTFPYNLFQSFFSLFTPSNAEVKATKDDEDKDEAEYKDKDKGEEALKVDEDKDVNVTEDEDKDVKVTEDKDVNVTVDEAEYEDKDKDVKVTEDEDKDVNVTEDKDVNVTEDEDKDVNVTEDEDKDEDKDGVNTIDSKKVMKITIKSINGLRPW